MARKENTWVFSRKLFTCDAVARIGIVGAMFFCPVRWREAGGLGTVKRTAGLGRDCNPRPCPLQSPNWESEWMYEDTFVDEGFGFL